MAESGKHPIDTWGEGQVPPLRRAGIAERLGVSEPYLSQVINGRKRLTLARALDWSAKTGLPVDIFNQPEPAPCQP